MKAGIEEGTNDPNLTYLITYARYLNNGGTPDNWLQLNEDDILMMIISNYTEEARREKQLSILIANAIGKLLSGKDE